MGLLVDGVWHDQWYDTKSSGGNFQRDQSRFRNWVTADGSAGPSGVGGFKAEPGRYHLYVSFACPWAHRTLILRKLKGLEDVISSSTVHWHMGSNGWEFSAPYKDPLFGSEFAHQIYTRSAPTYSGRVTVPILYDKLQDCIVSNESSEIIRMLNSAFDAWGNADLDFYPPALQEGIDLINDAVYNRVNNGVYRAGFATTQAAYEEAVTDLFQQLDILEERLTTQRYLLGDRLTEADWRLFTTLVRFDPVYVGHFKCNLRRLVDYPALWAYCRDLYQMPGVAETVHLDHIKQHYYGSHASINPTAIVPLGPELDFLAPHDRATL
ncbi:glutathione S-transferase family protein [Rhodovibrionaceae bacterium A322]